MCRSMMVLALLAIGAGVLFAGDSSGFLADAKARAEKNGAKATGVAPLTDAQKTEVRGERHSRSVFFPRAMSGSGMMPVNVPVMGSGTTMTGSVPDVGSGTTMPVSVPIMGSGTTMTGSVPIMGSGTTMTGSVPVMGSGTTMPVSVPIMGSGTTMTGGGSVMGTAGAGRMLSRSMRRYR